MTGNGGKAHGARFLFRQDRLLHFLLGPRPLVDSASCSEMPWHGLWPEEHGLPGLGSHRGC